jgi:hypothetical protein
VRRHDPPHTLREETNGNLITPFRSCQQDPKIADNPLLLLLRHPENEGVEVYLCPEARDDVTPVDH